MQKQLETYYPFWKQLTREEQDLFCSCSRIQNYEKDQFIHGGEDECLGILLVLEGQVRVYIQSEEGKQVTLLRLGKGQIYSLSASCVVQEISFEILAEAAQETRVVITSTCYIKKLMKERVFVENFIYRQTVEGFSDIMWAMSEILFKSFDKRLAGYLEEERIRRKSPVIHETHDEIAKNMGSAREVVSRMLKYFEKEGMVSLSRGAVTIVSQEKLRRLLF